MKLSNNIRSRISNFYIYVSSIVLYAFFPFLFFGKKGAIFGCNIWARNVVYTAKHVLGIDYKTVGSIPEGPVIFASKHQSAWETAFFYVVRKESVFVYKKELAYIPMFNIFLWAARHICLDRKGGAKALKKLISDINGRLDDGRSVVIFPEGTRKLPGEAPDYKTGIAAIYAHTEYPIVPVRLNSGEFWPKNSAIKKPGTIIMEFMPPIEKGLSKREFMAALQTAIEGN